MRFPIYTVAIPILAAVAFAQDTQPAQPKQPADNAAPSKAASDHPPEVKTQTYSGTLMDASCAGSGSGAATSSSTASTGGSKDSTAAASSPTSSGSNPGCAVAAGTTQFALKTKDGNTVRFDDVGNARVQEAMKTHKKWSDSISASKVIHVKASGVLNGDRLTVLAID